MPGQIKVIIFGKRKGKELKEKKNKEEEKTRSHDQRFDDEKGGFGRENLRSRPMKDNFLSVFMAYTKET